MPVGLYAGPDISTGNGVATVFPYTFRILQSSDLKVYVDDALQTSGYTVSGVGSSTGGNITFTTAPANGARVIRDRSASYDRATDYQRNGAFDEETVDADFDRTVMLAQQLKALLDRVPKLALGSVLASDSFSLPAPGAGQFLRWNNAGTALETIAASPDDDLFTASGAGGVSRSWSAKVGERVTALDFAVGDDSTDDTAEFAALEVAYPGAAVDLLGRTYLVSARPTGANYYNGVFRVGTTTYVQPRNPLAHPLDGDCVAILENVDAHYWPGPVGQPTNDDILIGCYVPGFRHDVSLGAPLIGEISYDGGMTWEDTHTIYADVTREPRGMVGGMVTGTRFGVFFAILDSAAVVQGTRFAYSDDGGDTWTTVTPGGTNFYPHGEFVTDDSGGINVFGYGGNNIYRARSTNNGANWTVTLVKAGAAPITQPVEPCVVKIAANKYVMFARNDAGGDMGATTSTDCATWTAWTDTNIPLGLNPPAALYAMGRIWIYAAARISTAIAGYEDKLLVAELPALTTYNNGGAISGTTPLRVAMAGKTAMIGYLNFCQLRDGSYLGFMLDGETSTGSANPQTTRILRLGGNRGPVAAPALLSARRTRPPITHNPSFNHWTRNTTFTGLAAGGVCADRWLLGSISGATADISRVDVSDTIAKILPHQPRYGMRLQSAIGGSGRSISQRFYERYRIDPLLDRVVTMTVYIAGTLPGYFRSSIACNFGGGGSATETTYADCAQSTIVGDITVLTATHHTPNADGKTWGTNPYLQFSFFQNDAGSADATIYGLWWDFGDQSTPLDPLDYDAERAVLDQYTQKFSFGGSDWVALARGNGGANTEVDLHFPRMILQPTLTGDAASNLAVNGTTLNAISFDLISPQAARMIGTLSAGTLTGNDVAPCTVTGGGAWSFTADVGH